MVVAQHAKCPWSGMSGKLGGVSESIFDAQDLNSGLDVQRQASAFRDLWSDAIFSTSTENHFWL